MLCKVALFFLVSGTRFLMGCDDEIPRKKYPSAQSFDAKLCFAQFQYHHLPEQLKSCSPFVRREKLSDFYKQLIEPLVQEVSEAGVYAPSLATLQSNILSDLCEAKFLCAAEQKIDSRAACTELYKQFDYLSPAQKKKYQKKWQHMWESALRYGTPGQISNLSCYGEFKAEHADSICTILKTEPIDTQLKCVNALLKRSKSFVDYTLLPRSTQELTRLPLLLRAHVASKKCQEAFSLFKLDDGTVADQLFMRTMVPFLSVQKKESQNVVAQLLEWWANDECKDVRGHTHGRCEKAYELINNDTVFKKELESTRSPCVLFWSAQLYMVLWKKRDDKALSHEKFKQEQLALLKKTEEYFAKIPAAAAGILTVKDNAARLSGHAAVLYALLCTDKKLAKDRAYSLFQHALESGINIADTKSLLVIANYVSGDAFLKLVEPYYTNNRDLTYSVARLCGVGCKTSDHKYWWLAPNIEKAKELYTENFKKQCVNSFLSLFSYAQNPQEIERLCAQAQALFPSSYSFKLQQALFLRGKATQLSVGDEKNRYLSKVTDLMHSLEGNEELFLAAELVCYYALKASLAAISYCAQKNENPAACDQGELENIASFTENAYQSSLHDDPPSLDSVTIFFDGAVCKSFKAYATQVLGKKHEQRTYKDLRMLSLYGHMFYDMVGDNAMSEDDNQFVDKIIACGLEADAQKRIPPLMHVIFVKHLLKNEVRNCQKLMLSHLVQGLQQETEDANVDVMARYGAEQLVAKLAKVFIGAQMVLTMYYKDAVHEFMPLLLEFTQQIGCIPKEDIPNQIAWINECGAYALLKEKLLQGSCKHCQSQLATVLLRWCNAIVYDGDSADVLLAPFFDDIKLTTSYVKG